MWSMGPPEPPAPLPKGSAIGWCFISSQVQFLPLGLTLPTLDQTPVKCRHTGLLSIFTFSEFKQRVGGAVLVACILLWVEDQKWGLGAGSRRVGGTYVEEQNELEGRIRRVAAVNGDPCFPQPVCVGSFPLSSETLLRQLGSEVRRA